MFFKIYVLKTFTNFIEKHLCCSLFLLRLQTLRTATLLKGASNIGVSCEICEIVKNTLFYRTPPVAASVIFSLEYLSFMWQGLMGEGFWSQYFHFFCSILRIRFIATTKFWKKKKLLPFDGIDLSHRKSKIAKEFT